MSFVGNVLPVYTQIKSVINLFAAMITAIHGII